MKDVAHPSIDNEPPQYVKYIIERLSEIPGSIWRIDPPPWHSTYEDWHVLGSCMLPRGLLKEKDNSVQTSEEEVDDGALEQTYQVVARVSNNSLRLERQYQLNKTLLEEFDPWGKRHIRALQLVKFQARTQDEVALTAILLEFPQLNTLRDYVNFGPNWYLATQMPPLCKWNPARTSSGNYPVPRMTLNEFLDFAIEACECCETMHQGNRLIHGEIRPDTFWYCPQHEPRVKFLNFSSGVRIFEQGLTSAVWNDLSREFGVEYKLQFMAPEQTGRSTASPNLRTDIYSLGITFYSILAGQVPFEGRSPMEVMQCILSRRVPAVSAKRPDIPEILSLVIQKMANKNIEDRYHSATGVKWDLRQIQNFLNDGSSEALLDFKIGTHDVNANFVLPSVLFGREKERQVILGVIKRLGNYQQNHLQTNASNGHRGPSRTSSANDSRRDSLVLDERAGSDKGSVCSRKSFRDSLAANVQDTSSENADMATPEDVEENAVLELSEQMQSRQPTLDSSHSEVHHRSFSRSIISESHGLSLEQTNKLKRHGHTEIIALSGAPGVGKSSLIRSMQVDVRARGYFCTGKFEQLKKTPFESMFKVMTSLFRQIFSELDLTTPFHNALRDFVQPFWPQLHTMLGLPEWLCEAHTAATSGPLRPPLSMRSRQPSLPTMSLNDSTDTTLMPSKLAVPRTSSVPSSARLRSIFLSTLRFLSLYKFLLFSWDDLQFADEESLDLILGIIQSRIPMILMFTFRDREQLPPNAARLLLEDPPNVTLINLPPLTEEQITQYVSTCLKRSPEYCFSLVAILTEKTAGNPFFIKEMLERCYRKGCITFSWNTSQWQYDLDSIFSEFETSEYGSQINNEFIVARLLELPEVTRQLLSWASIIGTTFNFLLVKDLMLRKSNIAASNGARDSKSDLIRRTSQDIVRGLSVAIASFIIQPGEDEDHFSFCHDRYQQAAAALPECKHDEMQFAIAVVMTMNHETEVDIFDIASHICAAVDMIKARVSLRAPYRKVLYRAADEAIGTGGKTTALKYCTSAVTLLQRNPWDDSQEDVEYKETLDLFTRTADCYWYEGYVEPALALLHTIFRKATAVEKTPSYILQSRIFSRRGDTKAAFRVLMRCVAELGFPVQPLSFEECDHQFLAMRQRLQNGDGSQVLHKPWSTDPKLLAATKCLSELMTSAYFYDSLLYYQFALLEMELALDHGLTLETGLAFVHLASIAIGRFDMVPLACDLGATAKVLLSNSGTLIAARGMTLHSMLIGYFELHFTALLPVLGLACDKSLAVGDDYFALLQIGVTSAIKLWCSEDLAEIDSYCSWAPADIRNWADDVRGGVVVTSVRQFCRALLGRTNTSSSGTIMSCAQHSSDSYLTYLSERSSDPERSRAIYTSFRIAALSLFGFHKEALQLGEETNTNTLNSFWSTRFMVSNSFYLSISALALLREPTESLQKEAVLQLARDRQSRMVKWGAVNDVNFFVWSALLSAQIHEFEGDYEKAISSYEGALDHADVHNFTFDQGLTGELYAEYQTRRGANRPARATLYEAIAKYRSISAFGKARQVEERHEWLLRGTTCLNRADAACQTFDMVDSQPLTNSRQEFETASSDRPPTSKTRKRGDSLSSNRDNAPFTDPMAAPLESLGLDIIDVSNILQSSQVLSSELNIERLLSKMTKIILESTGADLTSIVVEDEERGWIMPAVRDSNGREWAGAEPDKELEAEHAPTRLLAKTIITNCMRFKEPLLIGNILEDDRFSIPEGYPHALTGRAICAVPLSHGDKVVFGAIYMEAAAHGFTERNMTVLRLLVNPVSISITNALLFKRVEQVSASHAIMVESQKHALAQAREAQQKAKLAEENAVRNMKLKEEAVKARSMFLANTSHELRTPLNGIIGMSELLKGSQLTIEQEGFADSIRVCADTLLTVINDILDFSKLEAGKMQMFSVPLSLTETIAEVVRALSYSNEGKPLRTLMDLQLNKDLLVMGDPVRLHQILMNLLSNSYKFTSQGSVTIRAIVNEETDRDVEVTCSVADTGIGISDEQKQKLFKPFSQADSSTARTYGGTGLGLSICKAIIENVMHGTIWMESELGKGTTVFFKLRFLKIAKSNSSAQASASSAQQDRPMFAYMPSSNTAPQSLASHGPDIPLLPPNQIRICIAEDNPINQKIAISFVEKLGYTCEAFGDGRQAVDALAAASIADKPFHIVLMDVQMPVLDGYNASREIRRHTDPKVRDVIIIAMTASAIRGDREKCLEAGMNNYLAKPVRQKVLKQMLDGYITQGVVGVGIQGEA